MIALPCLVYAMDLTVLNLALPAISTDLAPSAAQMLWIIDIYGFMVAGLLVARILRAPAKTAAGADAR